MPQIKFKDSTLNKLSADKTTWFRADTGLKLAAGRQLVENNFARIASVVRHDDAATRDRRQGASAAFADLFRQAIRCL